MSLSLQDAQHVSWKIFRKIEAKLGAEGAQRWNPLTIATDLLEEAGEVSAIVKGLEAFRSAEKPQTKEKLAKELHDVFYSVFVLAEYYELNLEETFLEHVNDLLLKTLTQTFSASDHFFRNLNSDFIKEKITPALECQKCQS